MMAEVRRYWQGTLNAKSGELKREGRVQMLVNLIIDLVNDIIKIVTLVEVP